MHKCFNRFVTRMNYLSQYLITNPSTDDEEMKDSENIPW